MRVTTSFSNQLDAFNYLKLNYYFFIIPNYSLAIQNFRLLSFLLPDVL